MLRSLPFALLSVPAALAAQPADLIVTNATVYTADDARPVVQAFAVRAGRFVFTGSSREAFALRGPTTRVVDAGGATIIPGMVDAHAHLMGLAFTLRQVDLVGTTSYAEVIARVVERARTTPKGQWIVGRGWDQNDWGDTRFPTHEALSAAVPDHPVYLARVDGHAALVNSAAMRAAKLTAASTDPEGGKILRDAANAPTGVLIDRAENLVQGVIPPPSDAESRAALREAVREMHRWGLVGIHDAGASASSIALYERAAQDGTLDLRTYVMISDDSATVAKAFAAGPRSALFDGRLWVRSIKLYADGALGSRGAALIEPYSDDPANRGLLLSAPAQIEDVARRALAAGFQVCTHAIGDRGNRVVLDAYQAAFSAVPRADHRFRVEHAQILHVDDIGRFSELGVIPSMQASHQTSDMYWAGKRLGEARLRGAYAWRTLINTGTIVPNGSDFPVEAVNPLLSFHAAIARQDAKNWPTGGWYPEERMRRDEALKSMTLWPAYSAFQEREIGSISAGKHADFVVLDQDIMQVPAELVLRTRVRSTWFAGRAVYEAR
ncbi:MAG: amidohydrolase [Gemmatimonadaceae bacterium]|jgi:hypothetical protein|nr:amidohydrolase [Gemmatimonadaceae bacterium]